MLVKPRCQINTYLIALRSMCVIRHTTNKNMISAAKCLDACSAELVHMSSAISNNTDKIYFAAEFNLATFYLSRGLFCMVKNIMVNVIGRARKGHQLMRNRLDSSDSDNMETMGGLATLPKDVQRLIAFKLGD
jgi:hypothetical protein